MSTQICQQIQDAFITEFRVSKNSIVDLGNGANMNGDGGYRYEERDGEIVRGHKYDVGVEIGTQAVVFFDFAWLATTSCQQSC